MQSNLGLLRRLKGIVDFNAEIANRAFQLRVSEQQLQRPKVLRPPENQRSFCAAHRVGTVCRIVKPIDATQRCTIRAYCRVDRCDDVCNRLGNRKSATFSPRASIYASRLSRVCSVILNCTGRWVFCCMIVALDATWLPWRTFWTSNRVRSHARSLLSIARLNIASSRRFDAIWSRVQIAQISLSFNGGFCPVSLLLFHGTQWPTTTFSDFMTISFQVKGDRVCALSDGRYPPNTAFIGCCMNVPRRSKCADPNVLGLDDRNLGSCCSLPTRRNLSVE